MTKHHKFLIGASFLFALFVTAAPVGFGIAHASNINITSCTDLQNIGATTTEPLSGSYVLTQNIDCSATATWNPDGSGGYYGFGTLGVFTGTFNGQGHTISNLYIHSTTHYVQGIFSQVSATSTVENLNISGGSVTGVNYIGSVAGELLNSATIQNVTSTMAINGGNDIGGLVGTADPGTTIASSSVNATITATAGAEGIGGIVGDESGLIQNVSSSGLITSPGIIYTVGGIAGINDNNGQLINTHSSMSIQSAGSLGNAGGIAGDNEHLIQNSYFTGSINASTTVATSDYVGGIVGSDSSTFGITNSFYNASTISIMGAPHVTPFGIYNAQYAAWVAGNYAPLSLSTYFPSTDANGYYDITDLSDLENFLAFDETDLSADKFKITAPIALPAEFYIPSVNAAEFNGGNEPITGLSLNRGGWDANPAFIGYVSSYTSLVTDLDLVNVSVSGEAAGGLVNDLDGILTNSSVSGSVSGNEYTGGAVAYSDTTTAAITNVHSSVNVTGASYGSDGQPGYIGGFAGFNGGPISNSSETGTVSALGTAPSYIAGFTGYSSEPITNSTASGNVSALGATALAIAGFVAYNDANIASSSATGAVTAGNASSNVGGFLGEDGGSNTITQAYATGNVTGNSNVGGFAGSEGETIADSFSTGTVTGIGGSSEFQGGFVGNASGILHDTYSTGNVLIDSSVGNSDNYTGGYAGISTGSIINSYSTGNITGIASGHSGGFVGYNSGTLQNSYAVGTGALGGNAANGVGYFIGENLNSTVFNAADFLGNGTPVIGDNEATSTQVVIPTLSSAGYGADASTLASFYVTTNPVYAESTTTAWDFSNIWYAHTNTYPTFRYMGVPVTPPVTPPAPSGTSGGSSGGSVSNQVSNLLQNGNTAAAAALKQQYPSLFANGPGVTDIPSSLSAASTTSCSAQLYPTKPIKFGAQNDPVQVKLLQEYLNAYEGTQLPVDGTYSAQDEAAVIAWQEKYSATILTPWHLTKGTGYVYTTSLQEFRDLFLEQCQNTPGASSATAPSSHSSTSSSGTRDLQLGMSGADVIALQQALIAKNTGAAAQALAKNGATGYFGQLTKAALVEFQKASGITPAAGYYGSITRAALSI